MSDEKDLENVAKRGEVNGEQGFLQGRVLQHYMYPRCMNAKVRWVDGKLSLWSPDSSLEA